MAEKPPNNIWIGKIEYIHKDLVDEILEENLILQKQVHRLEEDLIKKTLKGSDVSSK